MKRRPTSQDGRDGGATGRRSVRRNGPTLGVAPGRMTGAVAVRKPVEKTYRGTLPVSGAEPPRLTAYERRRQARREQ